MRARIPIQIKQKADQGKSFPIFNVFSANYRSLFCFNYKNYDIKIMSSSNIQNLGENMEILFLIENNHNSNQKLKLPFQAINVKLIRFIRIDIKKIVQKNLKKTIFSENIQINKQNIIEHNEKSIKLKKVLQIQNLLKIPSTKSYNLSINYALVSRPKSIKFQFQEYGCKTTLQNHVEFHYKNEIQNDDEKINLSQLIHINSVCSQDFPKIEQEKIKLIADIEENLQNLMKQSIND